MKPKSSQTLSAAKDHDGRSDDRRQSHKAQTSVNDKPFRKHSQSLPLRLCGILERSEESRPSSTTDFAESAVSNRTLRGDNGAALNHWVQGSPLLAEGFADRAMEML
jgi:hypothetical protein